jgi:hypothetical protein
MEKWIDHTNIDDQTSQVWDQLERAVKTNMPQRVTEAI